MSVPTLSFNTGWLSQHPYQHHHHHPHSHHHLNRHHKPKYENGLNLSLAAPKSLELTTKTTTTEHKGNERMQSDCSNISNLLSMSLSSSSSLLFPSASTIQTTSLPSSASLPILSPLPLIDNHQNNENNQLRMVGSLPDLKFLDEQSDVHKMPRMDSLDLFKKSQIKLNLVLLKEKYKDNKENNETIKKESKDQEQDKEPPSPSLPVSIDQVNDDVEVKKPKRKSNTMVPILPDFELMEKLQKEDDEKFQIQKLEKQETGDLDKSNEENSNYDNYDVTNDKIPIKNTQINDEINGKSFPSKQDVIKADNGKLSTKNDGDLTTVKIEIFDFDKSKIENHKIDDQNDNDDDVKPPLLNKCSGFFSKSLDLNNKKKFGADSYFGYGDKQSLLSPNVEAKTDESIRKSVSKKSIIRDPIKEYPRKSVAFLDEHGGRLCEVKFFDIAIRRYSSPISPWQQCWNRSSLDDYSTPISSPNRRNQINQNPPSNDRRFLSPASAFLQQSWIDKNEQKSPTGSPYELKIDPRWNACSWDEPINTPPKLKDLRTEHTDMSELAANLKKLAVQMNKNAVVSNFVPLEDPTARRNDLRTKLEKLNVTLYELQVDRSEFIEISGKIAVRNIGFEKTVMIHYTVDDWKTVQEAKAEWSRCDDIADFFTFSLEPVDIIRLGPEPKLKFAIKYDVNGISYWDNNDGRNYIIDLGLADKLPIKKQFTRKRNLFS